MEKFRKRGVMVGKIILLAGLVLLFPVLTNAADYPNKPISLIVPYASGGATDMVARALAKAAPKHFPVPIVVINAAGGAGITGRVQVVNSRPDGYTLLFGYGSGEDLVTPHTIKPPYDVFKDILPVCQITIASLVIVVPASNPAKTLKEFVAWAKNQKREITGAVSTKGASVDITMQASDEGGRRQGENHPLPGRRRSGHHRARRPYGLCRRGACRSLVPREGGQASHPGRLPPGPGPQHSRYSDLHRAGGQRHNNGRHPGDRRAQRHPRCRDRLSGVILQEGDPGTRIRSLDERYRPSPLVS